MKVKVGDLVKSRCYPFHYWNGIVIGWYFELPEVLVMANKRGITGVKVPFDGRSMEIVNESR